MFTNFRDTSDNYFLCSAYGRLIFWTVITTHIFGQFAATSTFQCKIGTVPIHI